MIENLGKYAHPPKAGVSSMANPTAPAIGPPGAMAPNGQSLIGNGNTSSITSPDEVARRASAALKAGKMKKKKMSGPMPGGW